MLKLTLNKAAAPKYISRTKVGSKWRYKYADDQSTSAGGSAKPSKVAESGDKKGRKFSRRKNRDAVAGNRQEQNERIASPSEMEHATRSPGIHHQESHSGVAERRQEQNERIASPSEMEHAMRSPGTKDKRMMTAAESGRLAVTSRKSMRNTQNTRKEEAIMSKINKALQAIDLGGSADSVLSNLANRSADGMDLLQDMLADYEDANMGYSRPVAVDVVADGAPMLAKLEDTGRTAAQPYASNENWLSFPGNQPNLAQQTVPAGFEESSAPGQVAIAFDRASDHMGLANHFAATRQAAMGAQDVVADHRN